MLRKPTVLVVVSGVTTFAVLRSLILISKLVKLTPTLCFPTLPPFLSELFANGPNVLKFVISQTIVSVLVIKNTSLIDVSGIAGGTAFQDGYASLFTATNGAGPGSSINNGVAGLGNNL